MQKKTTTIENQIKEMIEQRLSSKRIKALLKNQPQRISKFLIQILWLSWYTYRVNKILISQIKNDSNSWWKKIPT